MSQPIECRSWGDSPGVVDGGPDSENVTEFLGMPLTQPVLDELTGLDLLAVRQKPADDILIFGSGEPNSICRFKEHSGCIGFTSTSRPSHLSEFGRKRGARSMRGRAGLAMDGAAALSGLLARIGN